MHRQIIRHWNRNIFGGNGIDRDIIFDEDSDYEQDSQIEFEKGSDNESNDDSEDDFDYEIDNRLSKFTSSSYENKRRDKEKKDKQRSADRKFHKNKKKASKKVEYNVPLQYIQELLNKLLVDIGKEQNEDEELSFYGKEEDNTVGESSNLRTSYFFLPSEMIQKQNLILIWKYGKIVICVMMIRSILLL